MLKGIPNIISPELLKILAEMGHGDTIVIGDGNFPAASNAKRLVYTQSKEIFVQVSIEGMYLVKTPPIEDILSCIIKKNALYTTYDSTLDEIWLLIYLPTNENQYSIKGVPKLSKVETHFKRIYISDWQQNGKLIYEHQ